jgi:riboflavin synthase
MFTGIVETKGIVAASEVRPFGRRLVIDRGAWQPRSGKVGHGDSIAVSGVCLTVASVEGGHLHFDVITETLNKTSLGHLRVGSGVNLESSLTASTPMGGHFVQGHVDGLGQVTAVQDRTEDWRIRIEVPADLIDYVVSKGSIAIDGVSMTVAAVSAAPERWFEVAVIPTTLQITTLGERKPGDPINLETDIVSKTIVGWMRRVMAGGKEQAVNWALLENAGFKA